MTAGKEEIMEPIGYIRSDFGTKFGVPRQSGVAPQLESRIIFNERYRAQQAFRGLEQFSHIWILWEFSLSKESKISLTVRPPRLGGNARVGVFASRSPFRPNHIGLSSVRLVGIEHDETLGTVLVVSGADMADGTPVIDIKPYLPYTDCHPEASGGYTETLSNAELEVRFENAAEAALDGEMKEKLIRVLSLDPRPSYQDDPDRVYGMEFGGYDIKFMVNGGVVTVCGVARDI